LLGFVGSEKSTAFFSAGEGYPIRVVDWFFLTRALTLIGVAREVTMSLVLPSSKSSRLIRLLSSSSFVLDWCC